MLNPPSITTARSLSAGLLSSLIPQSVCTSRVAPSPVQNPALAPPKLHRAGARPALWFVCASLPFRDSIAPYNLVLSMPYLFCPQLVTTKISAARSSKKKTHMDFRFHASVWGKWHLKAVVKEHTSCWINSWHSCNTTGPSRREDELHYSNVLSDAFSKEVLTLPQILIYWHMKTSVHWKQFSF